jgi:KUP system potassium uptake protein
VSRRAARVESRAAWRPLLALGALGVVFGDIGTSPLYAVNELFVRSGALHRNRTEVIGGISLVLWALIVVVACKYVLLVLRADYEGEGGVFALLAWLQAYKQRSLVVLSVLLVVGAGLVFGDGVITPAISVLSAVEGLEVAAPSLGHFVLPIAIAILVGLFLVQSRGTKRIGQWFGPIMLVWFGVLTLLGIHEIARTPEILHALNPWNGLRLVPDLGLVRLVTALGAVVLVVTGGEALFADLGHFGASAIRSAWFTIVFPALIVNYLGQGAFLLGGSRVRGGSLFFSVAPVWARLPLVVLATVATIVASQALITGAFSLATQGIALGLMPRLRIEHTHESREGQVYVPFVNWALLIGCVLLVLGFRSSGNLAAAYGLAVSAVMLVTTLAVLAVARHAWGWKRPVAWALVVPLAAIDSAFLLANLHKIPAGGWVPLALAIVIAAIMFTWRWGRRRVREVFAEHSTMCVRDVLRYKQTELQQFPKSMILLTSDHVRWPSDPAPAILQLFLQRFESLPRHLILLTVEQVRTPYVDPDARYEIVEFENDLGSDSSMLSIEVNYGFMETPDLEAVIAEIAADNRLTPGDDLADWIIHAGKDRVVGGGFGSWWTRARYGIFKALARNAEPSYVYFGLSDDARLTVEYVPVRI